MYPEVTSLAVYLSALFLLCGRGVFGAPGAQRVRHRVVSLMAGVLEHLIGRFQVQRIAFDGSAAFTRTFIFLCAPP